MAEGFPLEKLVELKRTKSEGDNKKGEEEMKRSSGPFVSMFMPRGVAAGNGEMVVLRPRLCALGGGDSSHAASGCVGRRRCWQRPEEQLPLAAGC